MGKKGGVHRIMVKIVILGSCRHEPYEVLAVPRKIEGKWNTENGYIEASKKIYPAIAEADVVIAYVPDGIGEHTRRDLQYADSLRKRIVLIE